MIVNLHYLQNCMNWEKSCFFFKTIYQRFLGDVRWKRMLLLAKNLDHDEELVATTTGNNAPRFAEWESSQASRDPLDKCYKEKKIPPRCRNSHHTFHLRISLIHYDKWEFMNWSSVVWPTNGGGPATWSPLLNCRRWRRWLRSFARRVGRFSWWLLTRVQWFRRRVNRSLWPF